MRASAEVFLFHPFSCFTRFVVGLIFLPQSMRYQEAWHRFHLFHGAGFARASFWEADGLCWNTRWGT
jgi:hypothetical protein